MQSNEFNWLNTVQVCKWLSVSKTTLYKWRKQGLPFIEIDGVNKYNQQAVNEWLLKHTVKQH